MSAFVHLIVSSDLYKKLKEKLGEDYEEFAQDIESYIERTINGRMKHMSFEGLHHNGMVGLFEVIFDSESMEDANAKMKKMEHALKDCHKFSIVVNSNLTFKVTRGDIIEL